jgi:choline-sulfatase
MKKPNIIYVLSDQHNFEISGFMGDGYVKTPNIDKLAKNGVSMGNCYCNSPLCVPSRSSMLSGLLPTETGIYNNMQCLPTDRATLVHSLSVAGYDTVLCGRMHFSGPDQRHGFEKRLVGDITSSFMGVDNELEMYEVFRGASYQARIGIEKSGSGSSAVLKFDTAVTQAACDYIQDREDERPLFMMVGMYAPHCPYVAPKRWYDYYYNTLPIPEVISEKEKKALHPAIQKWIELRGVGDVTAEELRRVRAAYYAMITFMDENTGRIMQAVEKYLGLANTVIIYGSDHGDNIGEHGLFWKTNFYEGSSRVPLIFSWDGVFPKDCWMHELTSLIDMAPTLLDIARAKPLPVMHGESLLSSLKTGKEISKGRTVISLLADIKGDVPSAMIRKGDYKLVIHYGYEQPQLFNITKDPKELNDIGTDPRFAETIQRLKEELFQYWQPDKAYRDLNISIEHYKLIKEWINNVGWTPVEEWKTQKGDNYLDNPV